MKTLFSAAILPLFIFYLLSTPQLSRAQSLATVQIKGLKAESRNGNVGLSWQTESEKDLRQFEIEYSRDGKYYENLGFIPSRNKINGDIYEFEQPVMYNDSAFYRIKIVDREGRWLYTDPVLFHVNKISAFFVYPSVINSPELNIFLQDPFYSLQVVNMNGEVLQKQNLDGKTGRINVPLSPVIAAGIYVVQLSNKERTITQKIMVQ